MKIFTKLESIEEELLNDAVDEELEGSKIKAVCLYAGYYGMMFLKGMFIGCAVTGALYSILAKKGYKMVKPE